MKIHGNEAKNKNSLKRTQKAPPKLQLSKMSLQFDGVRSRISVRDIGINYTSGYSKSSLCQNVCLCAGVATESRCPMTHCFRAACLLCWPPEFSILPQTRSARNARYAENTYYVARMTNERQRNFGREYIKRSGVKKLEFLFCTLHQNTNENLITRNGKSYEKRLKHLYSNYYTYENSVL